MYRRTKYISDRIVVNIFQNNSGIRLKSNPSSKVKITNIVYYFHSYIKQRHSKIFYLACVDIDAQETI